MFCTSHQDMKFSIIFATACALVAASPIGNPITLNEIAERLNSQGIVVAQSSKVTSYNIERTAEGGQYETINIAHGNGQQQHVTIQTDSNGEKKMASSISSA